MSTDDIAWTSHPVRHRPVAGALAGVFALCMIAGVQLWLGVPLITAIAAIILGTSILPFYVPTHFRFTEETIEVRGFLLRKSLPWSKYRSCYSDRRGALLTPFPRPSRLDRLVGLNLRYDEPDRERVIREIKRRLAERLAHAGS